LTKRLVRPALRAIIEAIEGVENATRGISRCARQLFRRGGLHFSFQFRLDGEHDGLQRRQIFMPQHIADSHDLRPGNLRRMRLEFRGNAARGV
jgi:hypothetical protein